MLDAIEALVYFSLVAAIFTAIGVGVGRRRACEEMLAHLDLMRDEAGPFEP